MLPSSTALSRTNNASIGRKLAAKRVSMKLSQVQLGKILGISQNKVSRIERDEDRADNILLDKINEFVGNAPHKPIVNHIDVIQDKSETPSNASAVQNIRTNGKSHAHAAATPVEAATRLHTEFLALIDAQGDGSNKLDISAERVQEALWWFKSHFGVR